MTIPEQGVAHRADPHTGECHDQAVMGLLNLLKLIVTYLFCCEEKVLDTQTMQERITFLSTKRELLVRLLAEPGLGTLRIDVNQALLEMDDLIDEFQKTFPASPNP